MSNISRSYLRRAWKEFNKKQQTTEFTNQQVVNATKRAGKRTEDDGSVKYENSRQIKKGKLFTPWRIWYNTFVEKDHYSLLKLRKSGL